MPQKSTINYRGPLTQGNIYEKRWFFVTENIFMILVSVFLGILVCLVFRIQATLKKFQRSVPKKETAPKGKKYKMSDEVRKKISDSKKRTAALKKVSEKSIGISETPISIKE